MGNSSSGILEVPSLKTPTVNIGDRQKGRPRADSVIDCKPNSVIIKKSIKKAFKMNCNNTINPYGDGRTAPRVLKVLKKINSSKGLIKKHFFDIDFKEEFLIKEV